MRQRIYGKITQINTMRKKYISTLLFLMLPVLLINTEISAASNKQKDKKKVNQVKEWIVFMDKVEDSLSDSGITLSMINDLTADDVIATAENKGIMVEDDILDDYIFNYRGQVNQGGANFHICGYREDGFAGGAGLYIGCDDIDYELQSEGIYWDEWPFWMKSIRAKYIGYGLENVGITKEMLDFIENNGEYSEGSFPEGSKYTLYDKKNNLGWILEYVDSDNPIMSLYVYRKIGNNKSCILSVGTTSIYAGYHNYLHWDELQY